MEQQHQIGDSFNERNRFFGDSRKRKHVADMEALHNNEEIKAVKQVLLDKRTHQKSPCLVAKRKRRTETTQAQRDELLDLPELQGYRPWRAILKEEMRFQHASL